MEEKPSIETAKNAFKVILPNINAKYETGKFSAPKAAYACVNYGETVCSKEIEKQSICIDGDIGDVLCQLDNKMKNNRFRSFA